MPNERKVTRGKPFQFPASTYNAMVDVVKWHKSQAHRAGVPGPITDTLYPSLTLLIQNHAENLYEPFGVSASVPCF